MAQLNQMSILTIEDLEESLGVNKFGAYVESCEARFEDQIKSVVSRAAQDLRIQAIFVSGPTSSGKTTFSRRLATAVAALGRRAEVISLDDYYQVSTTRYDEWGRPDFESIDTLDTDLMVSHFSDLLALKTVVLPVFDFVTRSRSYPADRAMTLQANDLIIVEGLHG
ncbi:MAG: hypothetical protein PHC86_04675, partial [Eubacteriales bacterium]|nr:hypothetical protein [Eubacteriales bacterium]